MFTSQNAQIRWFVTFIFLILSGIGNVTHAQNIETPKSDESFQIEPASMSPHMRLDQDRRISKFSSMPVPRYASLKYDEVNGRLGPSLDYPVKWQYQRSGLPVLVIRESGSWRKVRDPQGDEVWVHERMLGARRTGITSDVIVMFQKPDSTTRPVAEVSMGVVAEIAECEGDWCRIDIDGVTGWASRNSIWGADDLG